MFIIKDSGLLGRDAASLGQLLPATFRRNVSSLTSGVQGAKECPTYKCNFHRDLTIDPEHSDKVRLHNIKNILNQETRPSACIWGGVP